jgi:hypothetical protein
LEAFSSVNLVLSLPHCQAAHFTLTLILSRQGRGNTVRFLLPGPGIIHFPFANPPVALLSF